jgi:hypothetical protein
MTRYEEVLGGQLDVMAAADLPAGEQMPFAATAATPCRSPSWR